MRNRLVARALIAGAAFTLAWVAPIERVHAAPPTPNVLFVLTDDQPYESVRSSAMPYLTARPFGSWATFTNAYLNTSLCCPSRSTLLTGTYSQRTGIENNSVAGQAAFDETQTIATWLHAAGYRTGLFGKYLNDYPFDRGSYVPPGWDRWYEAWGYTGYQIYEDGQPARTATGYETDDLTARAREFIASTPSSEPFFAFVSYKASHAPWTAAPRHVARTPAIPADRANFNEADVSDKPAWVRHFAKLTAAQAAQERTDRQKAYRTLLAVDDGIRNLLGDLDAAGRLEDTVVVFMTDNSYSFGEHRFVSKPCPYDECSKTPLLVRWPGAPNNYWIDQTVSAVDVAATFVDLAGATSTLALDGRTIRPLLDGNTAGWRDSVLLHWVGGTQTGTPGGKVITAYDAIRTSRYLYVEYLSGEREFYDTQSDPWMLTSHDDTGATAAIRAQLHDELEELTP